MKIVVLHPKCCSASAQKLAKAFGFVAENPFQTDGRDYTKYDGVINYGCNRKIQANNVLNKTIAVSRCIDKLTTLNLLSRVGIPVPEFTTKREEAMKWEWVVVREDLHGNQNDGLKILCPEHHAIPNAPLYTKYFDHKKEFRVVVLYDSIVSVYDKHTENDAWMLYQANYKYLIPIREACLKAAKALQIDYVGFDVLVNNKNEFVILEANSGPTITDDTIEAFRRLIYGKA